SSPLWTPEPRIRLRQGTRGHEPAPRVLQDGLDRAGDESGAGAAHASRGTVPRRRRAFFHGGGGEMSFNRRKFVRAAGATAAASALGFPAIVRSQGQTLRSGLLTIKTGALAAGGIDMERGLTIFLKEKNYTLGGRRVELTVADSGGVPAQARTKMQELVERDRVQAVVGPLAAFEALAMDDYIRS